VLPFGPWDGAPTAMAIHSGRMMQWLVVVMVGLRSVGWCREAV
jgi:hypothetical protein